MQEKELRLGVILTGGISLAIYMHGVTRELHKLVRASRAFHSREATGGRIPETYKDTCEGREVDTENVYFDLLKSFTPKLDLRVIIDVIAGASAGGVNGIMLGRALAHDLDLDPQRRMWLENADVLHLIEKKASAGTWSKLYVRPFVGLAMRGSLGDMTPEPETRKKMSFFLRSRWFRPPFSGPRYLSWLLDANKAMDTKAPEGGSLLPTGHGLDLFVSVTDFYGHFNRILLHDPPVIEERDHGHVLRFSFLKSAKGAVSSDFLPDSVPGLVFAARATSCFPGAFPPASLREMDMVLARKKLSWLARDAFIADQLKDLDLDNRDPRLIKFIDGSVVNDKPFGVAIAAITARPAHRHVMRRIVYIEPNPVEDFEPEEEVEPGFFRTIISSLAEIPRNEPIHDEFARINAFNEQIRMLRQVIVEVQPFVAQFVDKILPPPNERLRPSVDRISTWRDSGNKMAAQEAGYAFHSYFRLKVLKVAKRLEHLTGSVVLPPGHQIMDIPDQSGFFAALIKIGAKGLGATSETKTRASNSEIEFLKKFDVDFRVRRLRFVIRRLNDLYRVAIFSPEIESRTEWLDDLKETLYAQLAEVKKRWDPDFYPPDIARRFGSLDQALGESEDAFAKTLTEIGEAMALEDIDRAIDEVFEIMVLNYIPVELRRDLFVSYIGFPFFDVLSFPMMQWEDLDEFEEILIDRISPVDANAIRKGGAAEMLRGITMRRFGGFFNRSYRENDYLWGRLNGADRLVDIILGAVGHPGAIDPLEITRIKHRLFKEILDAEEPHLKADGDLIRTVREEVQSSNPDAVA